MISATGNSPRSQGFTLVEIVVSLTVLALLAGALTPSINGVVKEHQAREPVRELVSMAREVRARAIRTQRPFQIGFDAEGCFASAYYKPYGGDGEYETLKREQEARMLEKEILEASEQRFGAAEPDPYQEFEPDNEFLIRYEWPEGMNVRIKPWGEHEFEQLAGNQTKRWVFQPSGMCQPLTIQMENEGVFFEARFNPLTAEIEDETSYVQ